MPEILWLVWGCGSVATLIVWGRKWTRMHANVRRPRRVDLRIAIPVRESAALFEPGVFGVFRPVLLLPEGITEKLTPAQLGAVIAHELCHVRRRDNLATAMHMVVEAMFWFHPLVWWIGARLVEERERACDEEVLRNGGDPQTYAEGILKVCEFYLKSPLEFVAGVAGGNLNRRIEEIMTNKIKPGLSAGRKLLLAGVGALAIAGPIGIGLMNAPPIRAQAQPQVSNVAFEVASVRPAAPPEPGPMLCLTPCGIGERMTGDRSRVDFRFFSIYRLIVTAFRLNQFSFPPDSSTVSQTYQGWMNQRFDISAKIPEGVSTDRVPEMLQALLVERFKLALHRETREQPVYALVVGKSGLKLQGAAADADAPVPDTPGSQRMYTPQGEARVDGPSFAIAAGPFGPIRFYVDQNRVIHTEFLKVTMAQLVQALPIHDRPVIDMTNLKGYYQFSWVQPVPPVGAPREVVTERPAVTAEDAAREALEKAGLRLEPRTAPVEVIVIDHLEKTPTEN
jgi:bla regulator protein blaR1